MYKYTYTILSNKYNTYLRYNFSKSYNYLNINNNIGINKFNFNINLKEEDIKIYSDNNVTLTNKFLLYPIIDITKNIKSKTTENKFKCNVYQIR